MSRRSDELEVPKMLAMILMKMVDEHYLASATLKISELEEAFDERVLLMAADRVTDTVYLRICTIEDQDEQMARMKASCTHED